MDGFIRGTPEQKKWWCIKKFKNRNFQFWNPIRQNDYHVRMLKHLMGMMEKDAFISLVVFICDGFLNTMPPNVIKSRQYMDFIRSHMEQILPEENIIQMVQTIQRNRLSPEEHIFS
jgi:hypothetical protein